MSYIRPERTIEHIMNEGVIPPFREMVALSIDEMVAEYGEVRQWIGLKESNHPAADHLDQYFLELLAHAYHGALVRRVGLADPAVMAKEQEWINRAGRRGIE